MDEQVTLLRYVAKDIDNYVFVLEHSISARQQLREWLTQLADTIEAQHETSSTDHPIAQP